MPRLASDIKNAYPVSLQFKCDRRLHRRGDKISVSAQKTLNHSAWRRFFHVSKLMLFPNLEYRWIFSCSISSRTAISLLSTAATDLSIFSVDTVSSSCTTDSGNEKNASPILYLSIDSVRSRSELAGLLGTYGTFSSSSASSSSFDSSSRSSFSFCKTC